MIEKVILICSCGGQWKRAAEAFNILFPNEVLPEIIKGRDKVGKFAREHNNDHLKAISKLSGKYSYYVELDGDKIVKEYDLIKMTRIA